MRDSKVGSSRAERGQTAKIPPDLKQLARVSVSVRFTCQHDAPLPFAPLTLNVFLFICSFAFLCFGSGGGSDGVTEISEVSTNKYLTSERSGESLHSRWLKESLRKRKRERGERERKFHFCEKGAAKEVFRGVRERGRETMRYWGF